MKNFNKQIEHLQRQIEDSQRFIDWIEGEYTEVTFAESGIDVTAKIIEQQREIIESSKSLIDAYRNLSDTI